MIAVIADDLTGAAEIAGIGWRYGLNVELVTKTVTTHKPDLLVVCTDSRSLPEEEAKKITADTVKWILSLQPSLVYKKIDSVLRGHVLGEIKIQMKVSGVNKALIVAANPSLGRTIRQGRYFVNDVPVHETSFAGDPEFAIKDASVLAMLSGETKDVRVLSAENEWHKKGIVIGEATTTGDIKKWVTKTDKEMVLAGAGDFFTALLEDQYTAREVSFATIGSPHLYVSGTAFDKSASFIRRVADQFGCVAYLPYSNEEAWLKKAGGILNAQKRLVIAFDNTNLADNHIDAASLRTIMAKAVKRVIKEKHIKELFIEGGSTAAEIIREFGITTLSPVEEWQRGVVRMKAGDMYITVKPGSYELPPQIKSIYNEHTPKPNS